MKYLALAVHDASPAYISDLKEISSWLDRHFLRPCCIKVIPNFLGSWSILNSPQFLAWLLEERKKGSEIIQHGYLHWQPEIRKRGLAAIRRIILTKDKAEFSQLDYKQAKEAIEKGKEILEKAGLKPMGFTSPTWWQR
ncbi:MAG: DUF2334 domain-containing protein [Candidatus Aminicenantales bacterium]